MPAHKINEDDCKVRLQNRLHELIGLPGERTDKEMAEIEAITDELKVPLSKAEDEAKHRQAALVTAFPVAQ